MLTVRPVATTDVDALVALYDGLSDDDRYWRFFSGFRPPRSFFERLVNVGELAAAARQDFVPWRASARLRNVESWR